MRGLISFTPASLQQAILWIPPSVLQGLAATEEVGCNTSGLTGGVPWSRSVAPPLSLALEFCPVIDGDIYLLPLTRGLGFIQRLLTPSLSFSHYPASTSRRCPQTRQGDTGGARWREGYGDSVSPPRDEVSEGEGLFGLLGACGHRGHSCRAACYG